MAHAQETETVNMLKYLLFGLTPEDVMSSEEMISAEDSRRALNAVIAQKSKSNPDTLEYASERERKYISDILKTRKKPFSSISEITLPPDKDLDMIVQLFLRMLISKKDSRNPELIELINESFADSGEQINNANDKTGLFDSYMKSVIDRLGEAYRPSKTRPIFTESMLTGEILSQFKRPYRDKHGREFGMLQDESSIDTKIYWLENTSNNIHGVYWRFKNESIPYKIAQQTVDVMADILKDNRWLELKKKKPKDKKISIDEKIELFSKQFMVPLNNLVITDHLALAFILKYNGPAPPDPETDPEKYKKYEKRFLEETDTLVGKWFLDNEKHIVLGQKLPEDYKDKDILMRQWIIYDRDLESVIELKMIYDHEQIKERIGPGEIIKKQIRRRGHLKRKLGTGPRNIKRNVAHYNYKLQERREYLDDPKTGHIYKAIGEHLTRTLKPLLDETSTGYPTYSGDDNWNERHAWINDTETRFFKEFTAFNQHEAKRVAPEGRRVNTGPRKKRIQKIGYKIGNRKAYMPIPEVTPVARGYLKGIVKGLAREIGYRMTEPLETIIEERFSIDSEEKHPFTNEMSQVLEKAEMYSKLAHILCPAYMDKEKSTLKNAAEYIRSINNLYTDLLNLRYIENPLNPENSDKILGRYTGIQDVCNVMSVKIDNLEKSFVYEQMKRKYHELYFRATIGKANHLANVLDETVTPETGGLLPKTAIGRTYDILNKTSDTVKREGILDEKHPVVQEAENALSRLTPYMSSNSTNRGNSSK